MIKFCHILKVTQTNTVSNFTFKISEADESPEVTVIQLSNGSNEGQLAGIVNRGLENFTKKIVTNKLLSSEQCVNELYG
jgi:hypothetical protein